MLSRHDLQKAIQLHFNSASYSKEMSETLSVFAKLASLNDYSEEEGVFEQPQAHVISLACGSAVGAETFSDYFPAGSTFSGIDIAETQTCSFLSANGHINEFVLEDLYVLMLIGLWAISLCHGYDDDHLPSS
tara:strand:+ start:195 stop:590 length:396 start_codon:yes stop_codon:yes gene_type:complete